MNVSHTLHQITYRVRAIIDDDQFAVWIILSLKEVQRLPNKRPPVVCRHDARNQRRQRINLAIEMKIVSEQCMCNSAGLRMPARSNYLPACITGMNCRDTECRVCKIVNRTSRATPNKA